MTNTIEASTAEELFEGLHYDHGTPARDGATVDGWRLVASSETDQGRWHERYFLVITDETGDLWGLRYGIGLTENQENDMPWEGVPADKALPLTRLYAHEVTRTEYRTRPA